MARQRRGGGFKPPELRGTLGTLLRTAAAQVGPLREALGDAFERTVGEGRSRLDDARGRFDSSRRRTDALADLGEIVLDLIRRGEIDLGELPEVADIVSHLDELDAGGADARHPARDDATPGARNRFDSRRRDASDDGTASSRTWTPTHRPAVKPAARVWRPPVEEIDPETPSGPVRTAGTPSRKLALPRQGDRKGGISFDEDDDLAEYMHPDDVPKKPSDSDT